MYVLHIVVIAILKYVICYEGESDFTDDNTLKLLYGEDISIHSLDYELYKIFNSPLYHVPETESWNWCLLDIITVEQVSDIKAFCKAEPHKETLGSLAYEWAFQTSNITAINLNCTGEHLVHSVYAEHPDSYHGCLCHYYKVNFTQNGNTNSNSPESYCEVPNIDDSIVSERTNLTRSMFQNTNKLKILNITHLLADAIEDRAFANMTSLMYFMMAETQLTYQGIPNNLLCNTTLLRTLIFRNNQIDQFPTQLFDCYLGNLEDLFLNENIQTIPERAFENTTNLRVLSLENNNISYIHPTSFRNLKELRYLSLSHNPIKEIQDGLFSELNLSVLHLGYSKLTWLNMTTFQGMQKLYILSLHQSNLQAIEGSFCLPTMHMLYLSENNLAKVPSDWFLSCKDKPITIINLKRNNLTSISPKSLAQFGASDCSHFLEYLDLSFNGINNISEVKEAFSNTTAVGKLSLAHNDIGHLPKEALPAMLCLDVIIVSYNKIQNIEEGAFGNQQTLETLYMDGNKLTNIDIGIFSDVPALTLLSLNENNISEIDDLDKGKVPEKLEKLFLSRNKMQTMKANLFTRFERLSSLDISNNLISDIEVGAIPYHLHELNLKSNRLMKIDLSQHGQNSPDRQGLILNSLDLSDNQFSEIKEDMFHPVPHLQNINIADNYLTEIPTNIFQSLNNLKNLNLSHNYLQLKDGLNFLTFHSAPDILDLSYNQISDFYAVFSYQATFQTRVVHLSGNQIYSIDPFNRKHTYNQGRYRLDYQIMMRIEEIYLSNCSMDSIDNSVFAHMSSLLFVDLRYNLLKHVEEFALIHMSHFQPQSQDDAIFDIRYNPIDCSCLMRWLKTISVYDRNSYKINNCTSVQTGQEVPFDDVPLDDFLCSHDCKLVHCICDTEDHISAHKITCTNITEIPHNTDTSVRRLYMRNSNIPILDISNHSLLNLNVLEVVNSEVEFIVKDGIGKCILMEVIDLSYNKLTTINLILFRSMDKLRELHLDHNNLHEIQLFPGFPGHVIFKRLKILTLQNNNLTNINHTIIEHFRHRRHLEATLSDNPWLCVNSTCNGLELKFWLNNRTDLILDWENVTCMDEHNNTVPVGNVDEDVFNCRGNSTSDTLKDHYSVSTATFIGVGVGCAILIIGVGILVIFRLFLASWFYKKTGKRPLQIFKKENDNAEYDAVIICYKDEANIIPWIKNTLIKYLEDKWKYNCFLEERNMHGGSHQSDEWPSIIKNSRRTIVLLSANFVNRLEGHYHVYAFQEAYELRQDKNNRHDIILVDYHNEYKLDGLEKKLRSHTRTQNRLNIKDKYFLQKLKYLMPENKIRIEEDEQHLLQIGPHAPRGGNGYFGQGEEEVR